MRYRYDIAKGIQKVKTKTAIAVSAGVLAASGMGMAVAIPAISHAANGNNSPTACGGKQIVNVTYEMINDYDSGVAGNAWANDTITRHLQVFDLGSGAFCATVNDNGSFVTFPGPSPNDATVSVSGDITGTINGGYVTDTITGSAVSSPDYSTHGNLGTFDLACTDAYTCPGEHPTVSSYVSGWDGNLSSWMWYYHTAQNGNMTQQSTPPSYPGNISG